MKEKEKIRFHPPPHPLKETSSWWSFHYILTSKYFERHGAAHLQLLNDVIRLQKLTAKTKTFDENSLE